MATEAIADSEAPKRTREEVSDAAENETKKLRLEEGQKEDEVEMKEVLTQEKSESTVHTKGYGVDSEKSKEKKKASEEIGETKEAKSHVREGEQEVHAADTKLGPKLFTSSVDMLNYFRDLARSWPIDCNVNKYEFLVLEDLIKKGHQDPQNKIGGGIKAFQLRMNPLFYSRCYYIIRKDGSMDDFSYRKCVDNILPLPEEFKPQSGGGKGKHKSGDKHRSRNDSSRGGRRGNSTGGGRGNQRGRYGTSKRGGGQRF